MSPPTDSTNARARRHDDTIFRVEYWQPPGVECCVSFSGDYFVGLMEGGRSVLKYPHSKTAEAMRDMREEAARYWRLGRHENLVVLEEANEDGLVFEFCEKGQLRDVIPALTHDQKNTIGRQIVLCLIHLHEQNFIHCDINVDNVFITATMQARVGDIQGQLYRSDGSIEIPTMSQENAKSRHPFAGDDEFSVKTDIFAFGTLLYHVWYGHPPFPHLDEHAEAEVIQESYRKRDFPIGSHPAFSMDSIIWKCWTSEYENARQILEDMAVVGLAEAVDKRLTTVI